MILDRITKEQFTDIASKYTISQVEKYFGICRHSVLKLYQKFNLTPLYNRDLRKYDESVLHKCKRTGEAHAMIKCLSKEFTNASIARVFGYSKERIREIVMED